MKQIESTEKAIAKMILLVVLFLLIVYFLGCASHEASLRAAQRKNSQSVIFHDPGWRYIAKVDSHYVLVNPAGDTVRVPFEYSVEF